MLYIGSRATYMYRIYGFSGLNPSMCPTLSNKGLFMAATKSTLPASAKTAPKAPAAKTGSTTSTTKTVKSTAKPATKATPAKSRKTTAVSEKFTKTQLLEELATNTGLTKRQVGGVLDELGIVIERHIKKRSVGEFTLPGLLKIKTVEKPARKARKGINPFTGEETTFKARPRSTAVKIQALKALKDMAQ